MKNALVRGLVIAGLFTGFVSLSACAEQNEVVPPTEEPAMDAPEVIEETPMMDDSTMTDSTMADEMMEEPMEEDHAEGDGQ